MTDDILSQEELDALLAEGIEDVDNTEENTEETENVESEEVEDGEVEDSEKEEVDEHDVSEVLTEIEIDALGEMGNISMGTAATTLSTLLNKKVNITTPTVSITTPDILAEEYEAPLIAVDVSYKEGLEGSNIMILKTDDAKVIADLMMGKEKVDKEREISDMDLSAVSEAMNQMMGSSATSMSEMLDKKIDIKPPQSEVITFSKDKKTFDMLKDNGLIIKTSFRMVISDYIDSNIMQLIPVKFGRDMVESLMNRPVKTDKVKEEEPMNIKENILSEKERNLDSLIEKNREEAVDISGRSRVVEDPDEVNRRINQRKQQTQQAPQEHVVVSKPNFQSFNEPTDVASVSEIDLVGDIPVQVTVELGRTNKKIGEILEFGVGTVLELDKLVGEPLNMFANGKYIASGEVVVIDDNFGVRITEIDTNNHKLI